MITELIEFKLKGTTTIDALVEQLDKVYTDFHIKQQGYIDTELIENTQTGFWQMIHHYETMEYIEKLKETLPHSEAIKGFNTLVEPETFKVSFYNQHRTWKV